MYSGQECGEFIKEQTNGKLFTSVCHGILSKSEDLYCCSRDNIKTVLMYETL